MKSSALRGLFVLCWIWAIPSMVWANEQPELYYQFVFLRDCSEQLTLSEQQALASFREGKFLDTRTKVEDMLAKNPDSFVGHFLMAYIFRHAEGELVRSLRHLRKAMSLFKAQAPQKIPGFSHQVMIFELFSTLRQLGRDKECLKLIAYHDKTYHNSIQLEDARPWILMKMHRYQEAEDLALKYLGQKRYITSALNALCAINFERNRRKASLRYCREAEMINTKRRDLQNRSVHLINLAEAYLSLFDLSQSEKYALDATKHFHRNLHSTPWEFLVGLYLDLGRYNDGWNALRQSKQWYFSQAPKLSESVFGSQHMTRSVFFLAIGDSKEALKHLEVIRDRPDRRGHMSSDIRQFVVAERLLRRQALLSESERIREVAATGNLWTRIKGSVRSLWMQFLAWRDGAALRRVMVDQSFLQRSLSPYRSGSFSMPNSAIPYWMVGDAIPLVGPAVAREAIEQLRSEEMKDTPEIKPYLLALEAESAFLQGDDALTTLLLQHSLRTIPERLTPLRARLLALNGELARRNGQYKTMRQAFARALRDNGVVFRHLRIPLPISQVSTSTPETESISQMLLRSPRFSMHYEGFRLQINKVDVYTQAAIADSHGSILHRFSLTAKPKETPLAFQRRFATSFQNGLFSPRFRLTRKEIFSLDDSLLRSSHKPELRPPPNKRDDSEPE